MSSINPNLLTALGCAVATFGTAAGSAIAAAYASIYASNVGIPWGAFIPLFQTAFIALYGLLISYLLSKKLADDLTTTQGIKFLTAGLSVGLAGLASGWGMAIFLRQVNTNTIRKEAPACSPKAFHDENTSLREPLVAIATIAFDYRDELGKIILSLTFLTFIAIYGLIVALFLIHH